MSKRILIKVVVVGAIALALLIPLFMIRGLIEARAGSKQEARNEVARSWTGAQTLFGPVLQLPPAADAPARYLFPERLHVTAKLSTQIRTRGQHAVPVYVTRLNLSGEFDTTSLLAEEPSAGGDATLAISVSDSRGIVSRPTVTWNGERKEVVAGSGLPQLDTGVRSVIGPLEPGTGPRVEFEIQMELRGMESLAFTPLGGDTRVELSADWANPGFTGRFLPTEYEIGGGRFEARWDVSDLATDVIAGDVGQLRGSNFGVSLVEPVDVHRQATRSVKYGILFIVATFTAFFLVEVMRKLMLHPMQYLLVGLALVIFFLLLLSLSEHMAFGLAYLIAAGACVGLISVYLRSVLGSVANSLGAGTLLGALYGTLYTILIAENLALLMGSLLLFGLLALVMLTTRRVDWYGLAGRLQEPREGAAP